MLRVDDLTRLWLWLHYGTHTRSRLFFEILSRFGDIETAYEAVCKKDFEALSDVPETVCERLIAASDPRFLDRYCAWLEKNGVSVVTAESDRYPALLSEIYDPPSLLFVKGTLPEDLPRESIPRRQKVR